MCKTPRSCNILAGRKCQILLGGREQVWRRSLSDRPLPTTAPVEQNCEEDELLCKEILPMSSQVDPLPSTVQPIEQETHPKRKLQQKAKSRSKGVDLFALHSERICDSDDEDDIIGLEAEDKADSLNSLLVLEERQEGIRRFRNSVDDTDRIAHCKSTAREEVVPVALDDQDVCNAKAPLYERRSETKSSLSHRFLFCLVALFAVLGIAALWRTKQSKGSPFLTTGSEFFGPPVLRKEQGVDQRPGSSRLENLQNRNRLSNF